MARGWMVIICLICAVLAEDNEDDCPGCGAADGPCAVQITDEDRRLGDAGSMLLASMRQNQVGGTSARRLAAVPFTGAPPAEVTLASLALPLASDFLAEAALLQALVDEINADPHLLPNTTLKGVIISEGADIKSMLDGADDAHLRAKACVSVGLLAGQRQSLMASVAKVRNTNHGFYMDMSLGTMPRYSEFGTSFGILGWSTIIRRFLDMVLSYDPPLDRFAIILPETFAPMADRFDVEQKLRGIAIVYKMIYDYRRVDVDATFEDADSYAKQIVDGVAASKANLVFQCFCSTNNKYFRAQLIRHAIRENLFRPGFQWFTHYPSVTKFTETWLYEPENSDLWPYLDYFQVIDQGAYEPPNYDYTTSVTESQAPQFTDAVLKPKIQSVIDRFDPSRPDRGYSTLSMLNCSDPNQQHFLACVDGKVPGQDAQRARKWDAIKHIAWTLHELIYTDGHYDFCDIDAAGVRVGDPQLFLDKMRSRDIVGFSGTQRYQPINVVNGQVLTLPPSFMLVSWVPTISRTGGLYGATKKCIMHVNRFALETATTAETVLRRDFFTGKPVTEIRFTGNVTKSPLTWYHDMCGKGFRIDMMRADKKCIACPLGQFNAPLDDEDKCESIANFTCPPGTYLVEAMAAGAGLEIPCMPCAAGTYSVGGNVKSCHLCPVGSFQPDSGSPGCISCMVAMNQTAAFTTKYPGAVAIHSCVCPLDTYKEGNVCKTCPDGMVCNIGSDISSPATLPQVVEGYMTHADDPVHPYLCKEKTWCPGGATQSCGRNRDSSTIGCAKCVDGMYTTEDGSCKDCANDTGATAMRFIAILVIVVVGLVGLTLVVSRNPLTQKSSVAACGIVLGLTFTAVQTFGVFKNLSVTWVEPISSLLEGLSVLYFDLSALRVECTVGQSSVTKFVLRQLVAPGCGVVVAFVIWQKRRIAKTFDVGYDVDAINAIGSVFHVFFVSIVVSCFAPFACYSHPGHKGQSMISDASVLCNFQGEHLSLVLVTALTVLFVLIPFLSMAGYATFRYRAKIGNSASAARHLRKFRFLFFRFVPRYYWYGMVILIRGLLVCLAPIVFSSLPSLQILSLSCVFLSFAVTQLYLKPWRCDLPNIMDGVVTSMMVLLLMLVSMSTDFSDTSETVGTLGAVVFVCIFITVLAMLFVGLYRRFLPAPYYHRFICHHKAHAAAQARLLQLALKHRTKTSCFLDSDHLTNLEELMDIVRCRIGTLIVYLTADTLRRPWCACEVTVSFKTHRRVKTVVTPAFAPPTAEETQVDKVFNYVAMAGFDFSLVELGVTADLMSAAFRWVSDEVPRVREPVELIGRARFEGILDLLLSGNASLTVQKAGKPQVIQDQLVISSLPGDDEATASAAILVFKSEVLLNDAIPAGTVMLADYDEAASEIFSEMILCSRALVVVLSFGSLDNILQLQAITDAFSNDITCIPVNMPSFRFPDPGSLEKSLYPRVGERVEDVVACVRTMFTRIFVPWTTHGSDHVLDAQIEVFIDRIPKTTQRKKTRNATSQALRELDAEEQRYTDVEAQRSI